MHILNIKYHINQINHFRQDFFATFFAARRATLILSFFHNFFTMVVMLLSVTLCKNKYLSVIRIVKLSSRNSVVFIKLKIGKQWIIIPLL